MLPCLFKKYLGFSCFGCGFQRSVWLLWQGDFYGAYQMYPPLYVGIFGVILFFTLKIFAKNIKIKYFILLYFLINIVSFIFKNIYLFFE